MKNQSALITIALSCLIAAAPGCVAGEELDGAADEDQLAETEQAAGVLMTVCWPSVTFYDGNTGFRKTFHAGHRWYYEGQRWMLMQFQDREYWYAYGHDNHGNVGFLRKASLC